MISIAASRKGTKTKANEKTRNSFKREIYRLQRKWSRAIRLRPESV